jgi:hypothetical protein
LRTKIYKLIHNIFFQIGFVKCCLILIFFFYFGDFKGGDSYFEKAELLSSYGWNMFGNLGNPEFDTNYKFLILFYGILFFLFKPSLFIPAFLNCLLMIMALIVFKKAFDLTIKEFQLQHNERMSKFTIWIIALSPYSFYLNLFISKDAMVTWITLFLFSFTIFDGLTKKNRIFTSLVVMVICSFSFLFIRWPTIIFSITAIIMSAFLEGFGKSSMKKVIKLLLSLILVYLSFKLLGLESYLNSTLGLNEAIISQDKVILTTDSRIHNTYQFSDNSILKFFYPTSLEQRIFYFPIRLIGYFLTPFPSLVGFTNLNLDFLADVFSSILYLILFPFLIHAVISLFNTGRVLILVWIVMLSSVVFTIVFGNNIIVGRYRFMAEPIFIAISLISFSIRGFRFAFMKLYAGLIMVFFSIYFFLKYFISMYR